jgi:hypothetical protein
MQMESEFSLLEQSKANGDLGTKPKTEPQVRKETLEAYERVVASLNRIGESEIERSMGR